MCTSIPRTRLLCSAAAVPLVLLATAAGGPGVRATASGAAATIAVSNCNDSGAGSLRAAIAAASSGDIISLRSLGCSRIVLDGEIEIPQDNLTLLGRRGPLLVDGNRAGPVFVHRGNGTLRIRAMSIGYGLHQGVEVDGGCIDSTGNIRLEYVRIHHCTLEARGGLEPTGAGGAFDSASAEIYDSTIDFNTVISGSEGHGGGLSTGRLLLVRSRVHGNTAESDGGGIHAVQGLRMYHSEVTGNTGGSGGGVYARGGDIIVSHSTVAGNNAIGSGGGAKLDIDAGPAPHSFRLVVMNSTISGNSATHRSGLEVANYSTEGSLINSTIVFNQERTTFADMCSGGLDVVGPTFLASTIVARNTCLGRRLDIGSDPALAEIYGEDNLVGVSTVPLPPDTISAEPRLSPLADNGGRTRTHALWPRSPAVDHGSNPAGLAFDQRGRGFARVKGQRADIGAYEH